MGVPRPDPDPAEMRKAVDRRLALSPLVEVRTFWPARGVPGKWPESRWAAAGTAAEVVAWAAGRNRAGFNVYTTINVIATRPPDVERGGRTLPGEAKDPDVVGRAVIPIDVDYPRAAETSASDEQRAEAHHLADRIHADLAAAGWGAAGQVRDTGNGAVLEYLCEPGIPAAAVAGLLKALRRKYAPPAAGPEVDTTVSNPSRVLRLAGTVNLKGATPRPCRVVATAPDPVTVTAAMVAELAAAASPPPPPPPAAAPPPNGHARQAAGGADAVSRCRDYLRPVPGGVMGSAGSKPCMWAARVCRWGFGLSEPESWPLMREYSERCTPPWSDAEIAHKLKQAGEQGTFDKPFGWLLNASRPHGPDVSMNGHRAGGMPGPTPGPQRPPPNDTDTTPPPPPPPPAVEFITSRQFDEAEDNPTWLVERVLVAGEPGVLAGPSKCLKTLTSLDLCISLASGTPFLGKFRVPRAVRVAFASAESGRISLKRNARTICKAKGTTLADLEANLVWSFKVPRLSDLGNVAEWAIALDGVEADVFILDPFYLALGDVEASDMFAVGECLRAVSDLLAPSGRTVILNHHANKGLAVGTPMDLSHMSHAGLEQYVRQFLFLNRRTRFKGDGRSELFLNHGGSGGFSGEFHLDVDEGQLDEHFQGKRWEVEVTPAVEARKTTTSDRAAQKEAETGAENNRLRVKVLRAIQSLGVTGKPATENAIRVEAQMGLAVARRTIRTAVEAGEVESYLTTAPGKPDGETFEAYRLVEAPTPAPEGLFTDPLDYPPRGQEPLPSDALPSDQTAAQTGTTALPSDAAVWPPYKGARRQTADGSASRLPSAVCGKAKRQRKATGTKKQKGTDKPEPKPKAKKPRAKKKQP